MNSLVMPIQVAREKRDNNTSIISDQINDLKVKVFEFINKKLETNESSQLIINEQDLRWIFRNKLQHVYDIEPQIDQLIANILSEYWDAGYAIQLKGITNIIHQKSKFTTKTYTRPNYFEMKHNPEYHLLFIVITY